MGADLHESGSLACKLSARRSVLSCHQTPGLCKAGQSRDATIRMLIAQHSRSLCTSEPMEGIYLPFTRQPLNEGALRKTARAAFSGTGYWSHWRAC